MKIKRENVRGKSSQLGPQTNKFMTHDVVEYKYGIQQHRHRTNWTEVDWSVTSTDPIYKHLMPKRRSRRRNKQRRKPGRGNAYQIKFKRQRQHQQDDKNYDQNRQHCHQQQEQQQRNLN